MRIDIETIFRKIPDFQTMTFDTVLFESRYPVLFTCKNKGTVYLFICYLVNSEKIKWIGTRTTYENLIELLENNITIRDAFLNVTDHKIMIEYDGENIEYQWKESEDISEKILPTAGEYMDAEDGEYEEELAEFQERNKSVEYVIQPRSSRWVRLRYRGVGTMVSENHSEIELDTGETVQYSMKPIDIRRAALA